MLLDLFIFNPLLFTAGLFLLAAFVRYPIRTIGLALMLPLLPVLLIRKLALLTARFCDWLVEDRAYTNFAMRALAVLGLHP